jgi:hypothetical protein
MNLKFSRLLEDGIGLIGDLFPLKSLLKQFANSLIFTIAEFFGTAGL